MSFNITKNNFIKVYSEVSSDYVHFKIMNKEVDIRPSQDIVAVVDISSSMSSKALHKTTNGIVEDGLSILDIVKHSLKTIVNSLTLKDRFSLVVFNFEGKIIVPLDIVTDEFKNDIINKITNLTAYGTTNLWDGLLKGMEELESNLTGNNQSIILLTDGVPNIEPPRGHILTFKKYLQKNICKFSLYTCGFGYSMESKLLVQLSDLAPYGGSYSFIPDSGMVGTIFINLIANIFNQTTINLKLNIPDELVPYIEDTLVFSHLGYHGQSAIIKLNKNLPKSSKFKISGIHLRYGPFQFEITPGILINKEEFNFQKVRYNFVKDLRKSINESKKLFDNFDKIIKETDSNSKILKLLEDYSGQVSEAFETKYYSKWGKHYLPSILVAHEQEKCNNFKDPGVQIYTNVEFEKYQEILEENFTKIPPPIPYIYAEKEEYASFSSSFNMNTYYSSNNPCYAPECMVTLDDGSKYPVGDIKKGMFVHTKYGPAEIKLVIVSRVKNHHTMMCHFNTGLKITPYHPIIYNNTWVFPSDLVEPIDTRTPVVISIVLDKYHILTVDNIETVTMGHNLTEPVVSHSFFGSPQVIEQLSTHPTFDSGTIILSEECIKREPNTNMVIGFIL